jgi:integrase
MARCKFCGRNDTCTSHVDVWPSGLAKDQSLKGPCTAPSIAGRIHASLEREDRLFRPQRRVFASFRLKGKQPRVGNMLVEDYLRPAAARAGILSSHRDDCGRLVEDDPRRFGFHNLRHSLASFLVRIRTDPKTVQTLLRHSDVKLTLLFYSHAVSQDRMAAAREMLIAILSHAADKGGLGAD